MQGKFITLRYNDLNEGTDLELPGDQPIIDLLPEILKVLHWPGMVNNIKLSYKLTIDGKELDQSLSLDQIGIENFQTIWITPPKLATAATAELHEKDIPPQPVERSLPFWENITVSGPCLISSKGLIFELNQPNILIGRHDVGNTVDIDLTNLENYLFISSRKHAEIFKTEQGFRLRPYETTNGTLLNGKELTAGVSYPLENGNIIQFGFWGVQLVFKLPDLM